jgi:spore maturation protein SpmA
VLNWIWLALVLVSVAYGGLTGRMQAVSDAILASARGAVELVIGLVGMMVFMLGLMRVARDGGLVRAVARALAPLMRRLFPDVPPDHPAMGAMVMNFATNILGLGNAATPFGLKAMVELDRLNPRPGVATDAMAMFLAINASSITLMAPTGTIAVRAAAGSADPAGIWIPTVIATACSTLAAVTAVYLLRARERALPEPAPDAAALARPEHAAPEVDAALASEGPSQPAGPVQWGIVAATLALLGVGLAGHAIELAATRAPLEVFLELAKSWLLPLLVVALLLVGVVGRVRVYESVVAGAREGLDVAVRILPYLLAILIAVGMLRASGALDVVIGLLDPITSRVGFPAAALPMALLRPLSGSGSFAVMAEILKAEGPDSFVGYLVCTLQGTTETTFYVLTLYFGAAGVRNVRYTLAACLIADLAGYVGATAACHLFFG